MSLPRRMAFSPQSWVTGRAGRQTSWPPTSSDRVRPIRSSFPPCAACKAEQGCLARERDGVGDQSTPGPQTTPAPVEKPRGCAAAADENRIRGTREVAPAPRAPRPAAPPARARPGCAALARDARGPRRRRARSRPRACPGPRAATRSRRCRRRRRRPRAARRRAAPAPPGSTARTSRLGELPVMVEGLVRQAGDRRAARLGPGSARARSPRCSGRRSAAAPSSAALAATMRSPAPPRSSRTQVRLAP